jgi:hypothetical protein
MCENPGEFMLKLILSALSFLLALFMGLAAFSLLVSCILPWRRAPETTHVTWILAGAQFTGWQLLVPFTVFTIVAVMLAILGLRLLKTRS